MIFEPRNYRKSMQTGRFDSFIVTYKETDLWIGLSPESISNDLKNFTLDCIKNLWHKLETYFLLNPGFQESLIPITLDNNMPDLIKKMVTASDIAGIGPMSSVAGLFSEIIGKTIKNRYMIEEIAIENGGDIYLDIKNSITLSIHAGKSSLSEKIGIVIPPEFTPIGICTSSGSVGPSISFGKADAVLIACTDTSLADSFATAFCNKVKSPEDIEIILEETEKHDQILSALVIYDDKVGIRGNFEMVVIKN